MDYFEYRNGRLFCEDVEVTELAGRFGTPLYLYSARTLVDHYGRIEAAFAPLSAEICFSIKCCSNLSILRLLRERGSAFDVVSGGELARALEIGADPRRIVFAGVGKTDEEIRQALAAGIGWFNVESEEELANLAKIATATGGTARVAVRVNPDVDPHTHEYTTTGTQATKFGIDFGRIGEVFGTFSGRDGVNLCGIHVHLGSPVRSVEPYAESLNKVVGLIDDLRRKGYRIDALNLGGGFGAHYEGAEALPAAAYAKRIVPLLAEQGLQVLIEPGRSIAANAGVLIGRVLYTKDSGAKRFVIVDAAMTDLIRPALYSAFHFAWPVVPRGGLVPPARTAAMELEGTEPVDLVGPVCESGDFLAKNRRLPALARGDLVCVFAAGAYGMSMSSQYNSRPRAAEAIVEGATARLIRRRETYVDLVRCEQV